MLESFLRWKDGYLASSYAYGGRSYFHTGEGTNTGP